MRFSRFFNWPYEQELLEKLPMFSRSLTALFACAIIYLSTGGEALSQPSAKELYDRCRKALNTEVSTGPT